MHIAQAIRGAIVAALLGETDARENIFNSRIDDFERNDLPAINVLDTGDKVANEFNQNKRITDISIFIVVEKKNTAMADLDAIREQVERVFADERLMMPGRVMIYYRGSEKDFSNRGERDVAFTRMNFEVLSYE